MRALEPLAAMVACLLVFNHGVAAAARQAAPRLISYVDPFVGVDGGGNTVPGAAVPFGFANPSPDTARGRTFTVEARDAPAKNRYVRSATLNGRALDRAWLTHAEISRGGRLSLRMSDSPSRWGGARRPPSVSRPGAPRAEL